MTACTEAAYRQLLAIGLAVMLNTSLVRRSCTGRVGVGQQGPRAQLAASREYQVAGQESSPAHMGERSLPRACISTTARVLSLIASWIVGRKSFLVFGFEPAATKETTKHHK